MISFDLPYKVKVVPKNNEEYMKKISIAMIIKDQQEELKKFLDKLKSITNLDHIEIYILDIGSKDDSINIAKESECKIEDGTNFLRIIDAEMSNIINEKFNSDNIPIVKDGDIYFDYSGARNYLASLSSNDIILMLDINCEIINFNTSEIENYIDQNYDKIKIEIPNKKNKIFEFYNRKKYTWFNIFYEILIENEENINQIDLPESILNVSIDNLDSNIENKLPGLAVNCFLDQGNEKLTQLFAIELFKKKYLNSAHNEFNRHLSICNSEEKRSESLVYIGDLLIEMNKEKEGLEYYNKAYLEFSKKRLPLYKLANHFYFKKDWNKCIFYAEGCLNIPKTNDIDSDDFMYNDGPYSLLYIAHWWNGSREKGKYYFDKAIAASPYNKLYINEAIFHYEYKSNDIKGSLSFQELQYLYNESKKAKSILQIYGKNARGTHALLNGCNDIIIIIINNDEEKENLLKILEYPGNLRILNMNIQDAINFLESEIEKFDMVFIDRDYNEIIEEYNPYWGILIWEKFANKLLCGSRYDTFKALIDDTFEISGDIENIWYKKLSKFEKTTIYRKKES